MDIVISSKSDKPISLQLYEQISSQIAVGDLYPGYSLPSVRSLARELGIGIVTVQRAYEMLEAEQFIYSKQGKGSFVCQFDNKELDETKKRLAAKKLKENIPYYKNLGISLEQLTQLLKREY